MKFTDEQLKACEKFIKFLHSDERFLFIEAAAGRGKSYVTANLLVPSSGLLPSEILFTAPTNQALKVVDISCEKRTIYSALGLTVEDDMNSEKSLLKERSDRKVEPLAGIKLLIIDEFSMINSYVLKKLETKMISYHFKVLMLGDRLQLPPIEDDEKSNLDKIYFPVNKLIKPSNKITLTKPMRFAGNSPLFDFIESAMISVQMGVVQFPYKNYLPTEPSESVSYLREKEYKKLLFDTVLNEENSILLALRNDTVNNQNKILRNVYYGLKPNSKVELDQYLLDEKLIASKSIFDEDKTMLISNGSEWYVKNVDKSLIRKDDFYYSLITIGNDVTEHTVPYIPTEQRDNYEAYLEKQKASRNFNYYHHLRQYDSGLKYPFASTIHKSQGGGFKKVFILHDFAQTRTNLHSRLWYVASSRCREQLVLKDSK